MSLAFALLLVGVVLGHVFGIELWLTLVVALAAVIVVLAVAPRVP